MLDWFHQKADRILFFKLLLFYCYGIVFFQLEANAIEGHKKLSVLSYLEQVKTNNTGIQATELLSEAGKEKEEEQNLITTPYLFSQWNYVHDHRPTFSPSVQGNLTNIMSFSLGVGSTTSFGTTVRFFGELRDTEIAGVNLAMVPQPEFFDFIPTIELSQSLWKNGFGSELAAQKKQISSLNQKQYFEQIFLLKKKLAFAEIVYWKLVIARKAVKITEQGVERAKKLKEWALSRVKNDLADQGDLFQSTAALHGKELENKIAIHDMKKAERVFNEVRGELKGEVSEELENPPEKLEEIEVPHTKVKLREDVLAAQEGKNLSEAVAQIGEEKHKPTLDFIGSAAFWGRDASFLESVSRTSSLQYPVFQVGLKFQLPLDFSLLNQDRQAYAKEKKAAQLFLDRKVFEQEIEWKEIVQGVFDTKEKLKIAKQIEESNRIKVEHERRRLRKGKTTFFQVLSFEQDYAASSMNRLRLQGEILGLLAEMKTFEGS